MDLILKYKPTADKLYKEAGQEVDDPPMEVLMSPNQYPVNDRVHEVIMEVLAECRLGFNLQEFQFMALHIIGSSKNLMLLAPTGSGKMLVIYLGVLILRKILNKPNGIAVGTQPLSTILAEKLDKNSSALFSIGVIKMDGKLLISGAEDDIDTTSTKLSHEESMFTSGELPCIMGHAESWNSVPGKRIVRCLKEKELFIMFFVDECHQGLKEHWEDIRPEMKSVPSCLQIHKCNGAPSIVMSATATKHEIDSMRKDFGLVDPVLLKINPVQSHINFQVVERPPTLYQFSGKFDANGDYHPGLEKLLNMLYLDYFVEDPINAKKAMIFFRTESALLDTNDSLCDRLSEYSDPFTQPWIQSHSGIGEVTEDWNYRRRNEITLFLTTSKNLMGIDLKSIQIIIFVRPLNMLHYILQGAGRGGRKSASCKREKVLVYLLFNNSDLGDNIPGMSPEVKKFVKSSLCLKTELSSYFGFDCYINSDKRWCCSNCINFTE